MAYKVKFLSFCNTPLPLFGQIINSQKEEKNVSHFMQIVSQQTIHTKLSYFLGKKNKERYFKISSAVIKIQQGRDSYKMLYEPVHDKTYNKNCATSKESDEPVHLRSLIRVLADGMCLLQPPCYSER